MPFTLLSLLCSLALIFPYASSSWTFDHACDRMEWTPFVSTALEVLPAAGVDLDSFDLVIVVVPYNFTNATGVMVDLIQTHHHYQHYQRLVDTMLEKKSKNVVRVSVPQENGSIGFHRILVMELAKEEREQGRALGATIASTLKAEKDISRCAVILPAMNSTKYIRDAAISLLEGLYTDIRFQGKKENDPDSDAKKTESVQFIFEDDACIPESNVAVKEGIEIAKGIYLTKDIVNAPHNYLNSHSMAETAKRIAAESGGRLTCNILEAKDCEKRGMGAFLGVARGSETLPKFIHLIYHPKKRGTMTNPLRKIGIVGKGLLMDTGGYNIKTQMMELMKFDCGGSAAVLGAAKAIAALQPEGVEAHFVIAACENMINERAMVPGDVLTAMNGKTIEVGNTDAEGRLTMADALVYIDKEVGVERIIELSTLTGACMGALGTAMAGLWTSDDELALELKEAADVTGEKLWQMPLEQEYKEDIKSKIADLKNIGGRYAGAITAALFLNEFVDNKPFAHVDMAGPVWSNKIGATGWGTKLVTEWVCQTSKSCLNRD